MIRARLGSRSGRAAAAFLAVIAYIPVLLSHPGRLPADTKLGLTLDPARLMGTAMRSWDTDQFGGWVPHQSISYLWPAGPFYWLFEHLGLAPWVVQRLWVGTVLLLAGLGIYLFIRRRGYGVPAALVAALAYQCSPYILPYVSRTSMMLLPWAAVGWLMLLVPACTRSSNWRRPTALFALVILTVGGVNLTATLMIAPAPILVLVDEVRRRNLQPMRAIVAAARIGAASIAVSLWWMTMLLIQGRYGADVLGYSETLQATSATSTALEVLRQSGYWLSYVVAPSGATTTAAISMMSSGLLVGIGIVLLAVWLGSLLLLRFPERWLAGALLLCGVVLAVGAHPIDQASPLMSGLADASRSSLALAMRSSTRAVPLITVAISMSLAALVEYATPIRRRWATLAVPALVAVLVMANLPSLFNGSIMDAGLLHDQRPPAAWATAASVVDDGDPGSRVIQLPGVESQVFSWGYTVDPPLAWTIHRPLMTRDWLPLGTPGLMDLWYSFDDRFQDGTADPASVAPVARFVGADTVWLAKDANSAKFSSATPAAVAAVLDRASGVQAQQSSDRVDLYSVDGAVPIAHASTRTVIVEGSGDGIVDAAAAGLLDGTETVRYAASMTTAQLDAAVAEGATVIVTDSNRKRAHQWRGSQNVTGAVETVTGPAATRFDAQDVRFPLFPNESTDEQSVAQFPSLESVDATGYGSPLRLLPEFRPALAVDGDPATAWIVGVDGGPTIGESITLRGQQGPLRLVLAGTPAHITRLSVRRGAITTTLDLQPAARAGGQTIPTPDGTGPVTVTIIAADAPGPVGIAELLPTPSPEVVRVPVSRFTRTPDAFSVVLTRLARTVSVGRGPAAAEETVLRRSFQTPEITVPSWKVQVSAADPATVPTGCVATALQLDGTPVALQIGSDDAAALRHGDQAWIQPCSPAPALTGGRHELLSTATNGVDVDRVVISSPARPPVASPAPSVTIQRGRSEHHVHVSGCVEGCWLVFGEGFSDGWEAGSANARLGAHTSVNGGVNAWRVTPSAGGAADITIRWAPQRRVDLVLWLSLVIILGVIAAALPWRRRGVLDRAVDAPIVVRRTGTSSRRRLGAATVAMTIATVLTVSPAWALPVVALGTAAVVLRRSQVVTTIGLGVCLLYGARMAQIVLLHSPAASFGWPGTFESYHRPVLAAVVAVTCMVLVDDWRQARRDPEV